MSKCYVHDLRALEHLGTIFKKERSLKKLAGKQLGNVTSLLAPSIYSTTLSFGHGYVRMYRKEVINVHG